MMSQTAIEASGMLGGDAALPHAELELLKPAKTR
ncbi:hypothetical protein B0G77_7597 [Paraburkholderia sp. BL10I2N1]|nr:hypothetical protein B0G77_7597 [Paraburkholderia sp. BL10I2N1]